MDATPTVTSVTPAALRRGDTVELRGTNLQTDPVEAEHTVQVRVRCGARIELLFATLRSAPSPPPFALVPTCRCRRWAPTGAQCEMRAGTLR